MEHKRTFRLDRLYHQLMKPKGIKYLKLDAVATELHNQGFITVVDRERYSELPKLENQTDKKTLFKILEGFKDGSP